MDQAIEQYIAAEAPADAARLIGIVAEEYYALGRWATMARWLDALPEAILSETPLLWLWRAMVNVEMGALEPAQHSFKMAIQEFESRDDTLHLARTLIESARHEPDLNAAVECCERALKLLPEHEYPIHAQAALTIGTQKAQHGDFEDAVSLLQLAAHWYEIANLRNEQSNAETQLGGVYCSDRRSHTRDGAL